MAKSVTNKLRTLYIMDLLLEKSDEDHRVAIKEMLEMLESNGINADRKTLYDDIETLKIWGMDILYSKEKPAGYYVASRKFELPELKLLVDAVQSSKFITIKKSRDLIKKLESMASAEEAKQLQRQVYIANRTKTVNESIYYNVDKIHDAIQSNKKISFTYYKWNTDKELVVRNNGEPFEVSPWALTWDDENYYMIGFDQYSETVKHYRVDKMQKITLLKDARSGEEVFKNFDMAIFAKNTFGMYGGTTESVIMEFENSLIGVIMDRFGTDVIVQKISDTHFRVKHDVTVSNQFYGWVAGLGAGAKIVHPQNVVDGFKVFIDGVRSNYDV